MTAAELKAFKQLLQSQKKVLAGDASHLEKEAMNRSRSEAASRDISKFADLGTDNFEQEFQLGLLENSEDILRDIDDALHKIDEGVYGTCEGCTKKIPKGRLKAVPYARMCIHCQEEAEEEAENA